MDVPELFARLQSGGYAPDALVFDLDGTLWDSTQTVAAAWNRTLERAGYAEVRVTPQDIARVIGLPRPEVCRLLLPHDAGGGAEALMMACYAEEELEVHRKGGRLYEGVAEGLAALAQHYGLFIVSNCPKGYIESFLVWSGLGPLFRDFECHGGTGLGKAENMALVARRNGLAAPVYVGDSLGDREAAKKAGWPFIFAGYGFGDAGRGCPTLTCFRDLAEALSVGAD